MHILVTNDDGVHAPGLMALTKVMRKTADKVTVFAPNRNWSASGHVKTLHKPLPFLGVKHHVSFLPKKWAIDNLLCPIWKNAFSPDKKALPQE